jgi:hypothetical protein
MLESLEGSRYPSGEKGEVPVVLALHMHINAHISFGRPLSHGHRSLPGDGLGEV